ncbi:MAG: fibronectin type III domain-containing protein [Planctomycetes bacterium]|nr:fibronectin type III domain-containing protein [Planctomycetota bacterium]
MRISIAFVFLCTAAHAQDAPTQIHLGYGGDASTQMVVMWRTAADTATHQVKYGASASLGLVASGSSAAAPNGAAGFIHTVALGGLAPDTLYYYACGSASGGWSATKTFRTAPATAKPLVIAAFGDCGTGSNSAAVQNAVKAAAPDLVLLLGDLAYANGSQSVWDTWFNLIQVVADHIPNMPTIGNHETYGGDIASYLGRFTLPNNERWYSFDAGDVHVTAIDCMSSVSPGSVQYDWVAADLAAAAQKPQIRWKIAMFHYPPFTSGTAHPTDGASIRKNLVPLFDAYHVDLALAGHEHNYERTYPLNEGGTVTSSASTGYADPTGTVYIVAGGGGNGLYNSFSSPKPAWSFYRAAWHGYARIAVDAQTMTVTGVKTDGTAMDAFTITKSVSDAAAPLVALTAPADGAVLPATPVQVRARAIDNAGVVKVEFRVDGALVATDTVAPFQATIDPATLAAGMHQVEARAYDLAGNVGIAAISAAKTEPVTYVAAKSTWKYHDLGQDLGSGWRTAEFDDSAWKTGPGILGYGEGYVNTAISYGPSSTNKYRTAYFRRSFDAADPAQVALLKLRVTRDDGFVAYLNGTEIARSNMPTGTAAYATLASSTVEAGNAYLSFDLSPLKALLASGTNVLAVEVHQASAGSSDLVFDAELTGEVVPAGAVLSEVETAPAGKGGGGCGIIGLEALLLLGLFYLATPRGASGRPLTRGGPAMRDQPLRGRGR